MMEATRTEVNQTDLIVAEILDGGEYIYITFFGITEKWQKDSITW